MGKAGLDFREFDYFQFGNVFCGSKGEFRWRIEPVIPKDKEQTPALKVWCWWDGLCFEKCTPAAQAEFPFSPQGLEEARAWLETLPGR